MTTAAFSRKIGAQRELTRDLSYQLLDLSERMNRSQEAQAYSAPVLGRSEIAAADARQGRGRALIFGAD